MNAAPRILLISAEYPPQPGGVGDYSALLAAHLAETGAEVSILTSGHGEIRRDGPVTVRAVVERWGWRIGAIVRHAARATGAEIIHLQYQTGMYGMHPAANALPVLGATRRYAHVPFITTFHDLRHPYLFPKAGPLRPQATRILARASDAVVATNGADRATLAHWNQHVHLIPIGSNIPVATNTDRSAVRERYGIKRDTALLTTFGLMNHSKGIDTAIDALALLREGGMKAHLLLVGAGAGTNDPTNRETMRLIAARCRARGVTPFVTWTGALPAADVAAVLAACDVCLQPYTDGASPRRGSLLAAMAQGIPIVTTRPAVAAWAGLPEPRDGETMRFVGCNDAAALADATRGIVGDESLATRLRVGARACAAQFTWPGIARQHIALYEAIAAPAPRRASVSVPASEGERSWR